MSKTLTALVCCFISMIAVANDYEDAWTAIRKKNFKEARILLEKATKSPQTATDAYVTLSFLQTYQGNEDHIPGFVENLPVAVKSPYIYSLWFNSAMLGDYNKKKPHQLTTLENIINDNSYNGSLRAAAHYMKGMHHVYSNDFSKAKQEYLKVGAIEDWQMVGPFENLSGSAFNNQYGPLGSANADAKFKGSNNIDISWFKPLKTNREGWVFSHSHFLQNSAIIYAQTFVKANEDMKVLLNAGGNGSLKIWVNDGLVISEAKERVTELDYYKNYCTLKKGYNRVVVQLGYIDNSNPNFIIRFTDNDLNPVKDLEVTSQAQTYSKNPDAANTVSIKHFAEEFFEKKISLDPNNLVNYLLLSQAYLRNERTTEARQMIEKALKLSPDNALLKFELIQCLIKSGNRTELSKEIEWLKENDQESYINYLIKIQNFINEEKYVEADEELTKMSSAYPENQKMVSLKLSILGKMDKVDELVKLIEKAYSKYPQSIDFLDMMYRVKKIVMKDAKGALGVYEKYLKNNYNYSVLTNLAGEYKAQGMYDKYLDVLKSLYNQSGYDASFSNRLLDYYSEKQNYSKALEYAKESLAIAPYAGDYWNNIASIYEAMNNKPEAIESYKKAVYYDRTNYDARKKLIILQQKSDLYKLLPETDVYALIKKAGSLEDHDYSYLHDEKGTIIHEEGASEEYVSYVVKLHTEKGIDDWKELYLSYNSYTQSLLIEKSEAIKPNGSKLSAERNDDQLVFTGLEPGDVIYVKYRLQNYTTGRLGKEFWDNFLFNSYVPSATARYTLILPKNFKFTAEMINAKTTPVVKDIDDYKMYTWEFKDIPALKTEPLMPPLKDVGTVLHISTVKSWPDVASWYSDLTYQDMTDNFELEAAYNDIFSDKKSLGNLEKARRIYNYIVTNTRYSSISFRQSALVPQSVSKTLSTRLGDCKDLSTLFVALAKKAGIEANLVLIDTRDNGVRDMVLPSMDFNHCIALAKIDGKDYYIELTDSDLPFGSVPSNLYGALSLIIPRHGQQMNSELKQLMPVNRTVDKIVRDVQVSVNGKDEKITIKVKHNGSLTSSYRSIYANLADKKQKEQFEKSISNSYTNPVKLESLSFEGLSELNDSLETKYSYTVKNEVIEAGSMKMIKVPFIDVIATLESISSDTREFPIEYWKYENTDIYETTVTIQLPVGQKIIEIPSNQSFTFKNSSYSVKYVKEGEKLKIHRSAKLRRDNIAPADYDQFKKFFNDIVEAESKYIVFK